MILRLQIILLALTFTLRAGVLPPLPPADTNAPDYNLTVSWQLTPWAGTGGCLLVASNMTSGSVSLFFVPISCRNGENWTYTFSNAPALCTNRMSFTGYSCSMPSDRCIYPPIPIHDWVIVSGAASGQFTNDALAANSPQIQFFQAANFGYGEMLDMADTLQPLVDHSLFRTGTHLTITNWTEYLK